ncbi:MAG: hypothetical protein V2J26_00305 [Pacificimonas sp.]|nr:hypothetical protein [Pacificimonas sp.]
MEWLLLIGLGLIVVVALWPTQMRWEARNRERLGRKRQARRARRALRGDGTAEDGSEVDTLAGNDILGAGLYGSEENVRGALGDAADGRLAGNGYRGGDR